jgi:hypothetical protein
MVVAGVRSGHLEELSMHRLVIGGFLFVLGLSGCASMKASDAGAPSADHTEAAAGAPASASPMPAQSPSPSAQVPPPVNVPPALPPSEAAKPKPAAATRPAAQTGAAAPGRPPAAQAKPKSSSVPAPAPTPAAASQPPPQALPTLNLTDLEQRLRETRAIGVFAKLSLKNQVDDLLSAFRELYRVPNKRPSAELRQRYDLLLLKVLSLLQDGDPPLASAIASSKEAIWNILADPDKFSKI